MIPDALTEYRSVVGLTNGAHLTTTEQEYPAARGVLRVLVCATLSEFTLLDDCHELVLAVLA